MSASFCVCEILHTGISGCAGARSRVCFCVFARTPSSYEQIIRARNLLGDYVEQPLLHFAEMELTSTNLVETNSMEVLMKIMQIGSQKNTLRAPITTKCSTFFQLNRVCLSVLRKFDLSVYNFFCFSILWACSLVVLSFCHRQNVFTCLPIYVCSCVCVCDCAKEVSLVLLLFLTWQKC